MADTMTDEEVVCSWMEPKPSWVPASVSQESTALWWEFNWIGTRDWTPRPLTLDRLREVESRLSDEQREAYLRELKYCLPSGRCETQELVLTEWGKVHATPAQKITALAQVLRGENR